MSDHDVIVPGKLKPGKNTTELVIIWVITALGLAQIVIGAWIAANGGSADLAMALEIIGSLLALAAGLGYTGFRTGLKKNAINAVAHIEAAKVLGENAPSGG